MKKGNIIPSEHLAISSIIEYIGVKPMKFMNNALGIFGVGNNSNGNRIPFGEFCFAIWNFCTLDQNGLGNYFLLIHSLYYEMLDI